MYVISKKLAHPTGLLKVASFQKIRFIFKISKSPKKNIPKNYPELVLYTVIGEKFKFQAQDSFLEYIFFFSRFGDLKNTSHFLNKSHL